MYVCVCDSTDVSIDLGTKTVTVTCDSGVCDVAALAPAVTAAGYEATLVSDQGVAGNASAAAGVVRAPLLSAPTSSSTSSVHSQAPVVPRFGTTVLAVEGMSCMGNCGGKVQRALASVFGVAGEAGC